MKNKDLLDAMLEAGDLDAARTPWPKDWPNSADADYETNALIESAKNGHLEIVKMIAEKVKDIDMRDSIGMTALLWASFNGHVFPARAGMNRPIRGRLPVPPRVPRMCGDEPAPSSASPSPSSCSPHTRG